MRITEGKEGGKEGSERKRRCDTRLVEIAKVRQTRPEEEKIKMLNL